jgi:indolepyruvate ferredoxin oxidoreductase
MAYKDEYEVARLYTDGDFEKKLRAQFEGDFKLKFNLAPPLLADRDPVTGELNKGEYGPWVFSMFRVLAKLKGLRGTAFDIFGYSEERRTERSLIGEYMETMSEILGKLDQSNHTLAVQIASLPETIRGFGHVKDKNLKKAREREANLLALFRSPATTPAMAAE